MVDWMARTLELPKKFLSEGEGGGVIQVRGRRRAPVSDPKAAHAHTSLAVCIASGHRERGRDCLHAGRADARREHPRQGRPSDRDQAGGLLVVAGAGRLWTAGRQAAASVAERGALIARVHCTPCVSALQGHSSIQKAAMVANVQFRIVPVKADYSIDTAKLAEQIEVRRPPMRPAYPRLP